MHPKVGDSAPDFRGKTTDGAEMSLADFRGKKLVLYFYPMDFSPACTMQACSLRDHGQEIRAKGAEILGVSTQRAASHQRFGRAGLVCGRRDRSANCSSPAAQRPSHL